MTNSTVNQVVTDGEKILFLPSGSELRNSVASGTSASFVVTMSGASADAAALTASPPDTGSYWSFHSPRGRAYKIYYGITSQDCLEPSASGLPNFTGYNTQASSAIKVFLDTGAGPQAIAEKTATRLQNLRGLSKQLIISTSFDSSEEKAHLFVGFKESGSVTAHSLTGIYTSGSDAGNTWSSQNYSLGTGTFPGIADPGRVSFNDANVRLELSGSDSDFVLASTLCPYPFVLPKATFHSATVAVSELAIPKKYFSLVACPV